MQGGGWGKAELLQYPDKTRWNLKLEMGVGYRNTQEVKLVSHED